MAEANSSQRRTLPRQETVAKLVFDLILEEFARSDQFSHSRAPTIFIVYAHDNHDSQSVEFHAHAQSSQRIIEWLRVSRARSVSDRNPLPWWLPRSDDSTAGDIVSSQCRLLPDRKPDSTIDKVILCGSPLLRHYTFDGFSDTYTSAVYRAYSHEDESQRGIRRLVETQTARRGFHHVLTELAFLGIRRRHLQEHHGIVPLSLCGVGESHHIGYLDCLQPSDVWLKSNTRIESLHELFFKVLFRVYGHDYYQFISCFQKCYKDACLRALGEPSISDERALAIGREEIQRAYSSIGAMLHAAERYRRSQTASIGLEFPDAVPEAAFNHERNTKLPSCLEGTRRELFDDMKQWAISRGGKRIYWLTGMAGTGKSTIALTLAREYHSERRLGASFFFSRGQGNISRSENFAFTIAAELGQTSVGLKSAILEAYRTSPQIHHKGLITQWEELVVLPLRRVGGNQLPDPLVIIIDALDECDDESGVSDIMHCLRLAANIDNVNLRIFVTSRPDNAPRLGQSRISSSAPVDCILHDIERSIVDRDLESYYQHELEFVARRYAPSLESLIEGPAIPFLVQQSHGLFIHAATVCRFVREGGHQYAHERIQVIIDNGVHGLQPETELDELYTSVLRHTVLAPGRNYRNTEHTRAQFSFRVCVGAVMLLFDPLPLAGLDMLLNSTNGPKLNVSGTIRSLSSLLDIPVDETRPVTPLHPSFRDFLLSRRRCRDPSFAIDASVVHRRLFDTCVAVLSANLRRDMYRLREPATRISKVAAAATEYALPHAVKYACRHWINHLLHCTRDMVHDPHLLDTVITFFNKKFLYWVEALALTGQLSFGMALMGRLEQHLKTAQQGRKSRLRRFIHVISAKKDQLGSVDRHELSSIVHDAQRFLFSQSPILQDTPLQTYSAALIFSPGTSIIRNRYSNFITTRQWHSDAVYSHWNANLRAMHGHSSKVHDVCISSDGAIAVSGSQDQTTRIWDTTTGTERHVLESHSPVLALAISPDDHTIATGLRNGKTQLWELTTGSKKTEIRAHASRIVAVGFSPDSRLLVTVCRRGIIKLWDVETGSKRRELENHDFGTSDIVAAAFSRTGVAILANKRGWAWVMDLTVRLWDLPRGVSWWRINNYPMVSAVTISPDGGLIAAARGSSLQPLRRSSWWSWSGRSSQSQIRVWDLKTGAEYDVQRGNSSYHDEQAIAFTPDGQSIVCGYPYGTIKLGGPPSSIGSRRHFSIEPDRTSFTAATVSPDSRIVVSGSSVGIVRLWHATSNLNFGGLSCYREPSKPIAISPSGDLIAIRSSSRTSLVVFDTSTGEPQMEWPSGGGMSRHFRLGAVAFSPDGSQLAISSNRRVIVWQIRTHSINTRKTYLDYRGDIRFRFRSFSPDRKPTAVAFAHSGDHIAVGFSDGVIELRDICDGHLLRVLGPQPSPSPSPSSSSYFPTSSSAPGHAVTAAPAVTGLAFSPCDAMVAAGLATGAVQLWGARDEVLLDTSAGAHREGVTAVAFSPDGGTVVSCAGDRTLGLWRINGEGETGGEEETGRRRRRRETTAPRRRPRQIGVVIQSMFFSRDGRQLITDRGAMPVRETGFRRSSLVFASERWVLRNNKEVLAIPPEFQSLIWFVAGQTLHFYDSDRRRLVGLVLSGVLKQDR